MISVFEFDDYKTYLKALEAERQTFQRGFRSRIAEALNCQNAYISQVLNTDANFSLEQGLQITKFLALNESAIRFFLLLLEHARAGTTELKKYFETDLQQLRTKNLDLTQKIQDHTQLSSEQQTTYYSSWLYPTIHILITIPKFRTLSSIAQALHIDLDTVKEIVLFLHSTHLIKEKSGEFFPSNSQVHLSKNSPHIRQHHANCRMMAIQSLSKNFRDDIHYSTVSSLSYKDAEKLKSLFTDIIKNYVETIKPSKEETLYNFNLDFYSIL